MVELVPKAPNLVAACTAATEREIDLVTSNLVVARVVQVGDVIDGAALTGQCNGQKTVLLLTRGVFDLNKLLVQVHAKKWRMK